MNLFLFCVIFFIKTRSFPTKTAEGKIRIVRLSDVLKLKQSLEQTKLYFV